MHLFVFAIILKNVFFMWVLLNFGKDLGWYAQKGSSSSLSKNQIKFTAVYTTLELDPFVNTAPGLYSAPPPPKKKILNI